MRSNSIRCFRFLHEDVGHLVLRFTALAPACSRRAYKVARGSVCLFLHVASSPIVAPVGECQPCPQNSDEKKKPHKNNVPGALECVISLDVGQPPAANHRRHRRWLRLLLIPNVLINIYFHSCVAAVHRKKKQTNSVWNIALIVTIASVQRAVEQ